MKHLVQTTLMLLTLSAGAALAQAPTQSTDPNPSAPQQQGQYHHHAPNPEHQARMLSRKLGLTADQSAQVAPILAARDQQIETLHQNPPSDPKAMHQQMRSIQQDTDAKLNAIFNDQQRQQYAQIEAERHHHGHNGAPVDGSQQPAPQPSV